MSEVNHIDRTFCKDNSASCNLSIQADRNGLAYCIRHVRQGDYVVFRKYRFDHVFMASDLVRHVINVLDKDDILHLPFHSVHFMGYTQQSVLVPSSMFIRENLNDYIDFNTGGIFEGEIFSNPIRPLDAHSVFALPRALVSLFTLHFKKVEFSSQTTPFLWNITRNIGSTDTSTIYAGLNADFFDIAVTGMGRLLLYNTFQYVNETDLLYYVLYVCKQLALNHQEIPVKLSGELSSRLAFVETLKQYLPDIGHDSASDLPVLASGLMPVVIYKYLNLFNLQSCELSAENIKAE